MVIKVEVFSTPGCGRCAQARDALKAIVEALGAERVSWREIDVLEEIDYAVELGVMSPPAIAIDRELVFPSLPSAQSFQAELTRRLARTADHSHHEPGKPAEGVSNGGY